MDAAEVSTALRALIEACEVPEEFCPVAFKEVQSYADVGVLTRDAGFVLTLEDGSEFQVTIVLSRRGRDRGERE